MSKTKCTLRPVSKFQLSKRACSNTGLKQRGVASIEFSLVLIPLLIVTFAVGDFAFYFYQQYRLDRSTHSLATVLAQHQFSATHTVTSAKPIYDGAEDDYLRAAQQLLSAGSGTKLGIVLRFFGEASGSRHRQAAGDTCKQLQLDDKSTATDLAGAPFSSESKRNFYAIELCYQPDYPSLATGLLGADLFSGQLHSHALAISRSPLPSP